MGCKKKTYNVVEHVLDCVAFRQPAVDTLDGETDKLVDRCVICAGKRQDDGRQPREVVQRCDGTEMNGLDRTQSINGVDVRGKLLDNLPEATLILVLEHVKSSIKAVQGIRPGAQLLSPCTTHNKSPMKSNLEDENKSIESQTHHEIIYVK
jgi:hypothetical protein